MRLVIQRARRAAVRVGKDTVSEIGPGLLVLVGVGRGDRRDEAEWLAGKVYNLRIFEDSDGRMNRSLAEVGGEVLVVPQFTLYGDASKGRRPSPSATGRAWSSPTVGGSGSGRRSPPWAP